MVYVNIVAVIVAAAVSLAIGALWYSPWLFGKKWMKLTGITQKELKKEKKQGLAKFYLGAIVTTLVTAGVLALFVSFAKATTIHQGLYVGFLAWLGFVGTTTLGKVLWERKPFALWILNNAFNLLSLLFMGAILALW